MDTNVVVNVVLVNLKEWQKKDWLYLTNFALNHLVFFKLKILISLKSDLDDRWFSNGSLGMQELVVKIVVPVRPSECNRVTQCAPNPTASY